MADVTDTFYEGSAFHGYGTQLLVGQDDGTPETFTAVSDTVSIVPGDMTTVVLEKTHLRSPDAHREKLAGLRDSGPFTVNLRWLPKHGSQNNAGGDGFATPGGLLYLWRNRVERNMQIICSDGSPATTFAFRGVVTRFQPGEIGNEDVTNATAEITPLNGSYHAALP